MVIFHSNVKLPEGTYFWTWIWQDLGTQLEESLQWNRDEARDTANANNDIWIV